MSNQPFPPVDTSDGAVIVNEGKRGRNKALLLAVLGLGIGGMCLYAVFTGHVIRGAHHGVGGDQQGSTGQYIAAGVLGGIFAMIGLFPLLFLKVLARPRGYVVDAWGIRWCDSSATTVGWRLPWHDFAAVAIGVSQRNTGQEVRATPGGLLYRYLADLLSPTLVVLRATPHDPDYGRTHSKVEVADGEVIVPLGAERKYGAITDAALRRFAPQLYRGVVPWKPRQNQQSTK